MKNQTTLLVKSKKEGGEKMKKSLLMIAAVLLFAVPAMAAIKDTKHNLGSSGTGTFKTGVTSEICIFCHTPHNAGGQGPLWNRTTTAAGTTYSSPTLNNTPDVAYLNSAVAVAPLCLSCHDGATGLGSAIVNKFDKTALVGFTDTITGGASLSTDLSNDHPVGMQYNPGLDLSPYGVTGLRTAQASFPTDPTTGPQTGWFRTGGAYSNMMDCSSCHDVHGKDGNPKFLRRSNASSNFCITCHIK